MVRKVVKRMVDRFRRPRFSGPLSFGVGVDRETYDALLEQKRRTGGVEQMTKVAASVGLGASNLVTFVSNPSFRERLARVVTISLSVMGSGAGKVHSYHFPGIRQATLEVGKRLGDESLHNIELRRFLGKYKYVYVDRKGRIAGTNMPRLIPGVGRIRLSSHKILAGAY
ncbi:MAG: hypothetical protein V1776_05335 [Candidatus Diapherotrites archaeon]